MLSTNNKNFKILALAISALIVGVEAQVTCTSSSPQCCWVVRSWQLLGKAIPTGIKSTDNSCCTKPLDGVYCDSTKTNVTMIAWSNLALTGFIPPEIGKLTSLTYLSLSSNQLSGSIPAEVGNLINLKDLYLKNNQLSGSIPAAIGNLKNLTYLHLQSNQLSGSIPAAIGNLKNLTWLHLQSNQLSGSIPAAIGNLKNLTWLHLQSNQLSGSIPAAIGNLKNLTSLLLGNNTLSGSIPAWIGNLTNLIRLRLDRNQLSGSIPAAIGNLTKLTDLALYDNPLSGSFTPNCLTQIYATNTPVTLCGCATSGSPANLFPPAGTSLECLSSGPASTPLAKRALVFSQNIGAFKYTCNNDPYGNPYQDCLNAQGAICHKDYIGTNSTRLVECKAGVDKMTKGLSYHWQNVRKACGQWSFDGAVMGPYNPSNCETANIALQQNAFYLLPDGTRAAVPADLTNSVTAGLWSNIK